MMLLRDSSPVLSCHKGAVMALGNFDGVHRGHRAVIQKAVEMAHALGKPAAVMTFEPHPRRVFSPHLPPLRILPLREKIRMLQGMDIDFLRIVRFTRAFSETAAEDFARHVLAGQLAVAQVVTGEDFVFGHNREGNAESLSDMGQKYGFSATACPAVTVDGQRCSSTRIREALAKGDMDTAKALLGRAYTLKGFVREGDKRGRTLGFPTANLLPPPVFLPAHGVYAVRVHIRGQSVQGVANLGLRPTFGGTEMRLEVHLFDWSEDIYGERLEVELVRHIRGERKFDGMEALKAQIEKDCEEARRVFNGN